MGCCSCEQLMSSSSSLCDHLCVCVCVCILHKNYSIVVHILCEV